ncbi:MAG: hypothetical protein C4322_21590, partial [Mastigocladus sp. ERB_26_1]
MKKIKKLYQNQNSFFYLFSFYFLLLSPSPVFASVVDGRQGDKQTRETRETQGHSEAGKQISAPSEVSP